MGYIRSVIVAFPGHIHLLFDFSQNTKFLTDQNKLEFRESDVSPGKTDVKQGKFVEFISRAKLINRETYKSQNINPISPTSQGCV